MTDGPGAPTTRRALVVDDEGEPGRPVGDCLSRWFAVDVVRTGADALQRLTQ